MEENKEKSLLINILNLDNLDEDEEEKCKICFLDPKHIIKLDCGHKFCYKCLIESFKGIKCNFCKKNSHKICPYCRTPTSYLPLIEGNIPIKGIHREYGKNIKPFKLCDAILKSGLKKGNKCNCIVKNGNYCGRHKKLNN